MIFYKSQLMPDDASQTLFMVNNSNSFKSFEDHKAAIFLHLHILVEAAIEENENPIGLIEDYLGIVYDHGDSVSDIVNYLFHIGQMQSALWQLKIRWDHLDQNLSDENSLITSGLSSKAILQHYSTITLRSYLEALEGIMN